MKLYAVVDCLEILRALSAGKINAVSVLERLAGWARNPKSYPSPHSLSITAGGGSTNFLNYSLSLSLLPLSTTKQEVR